MKEKLLKEKQKSYRHLLYEELLSPSEYEVNRKHKALQKNSMFPLPRIQIEVIIELVKTKKYYQHEIAAELGINQGRVSELVNGKCHGLMVMKPLPQSMIEEVFH